eukprot:1729905-Prorocentrum_lima.AAC.1
MSRKSYLVSIHWPSDLVIHGVRGVAIREDGLTHGQANAHPGVQLGSNPVDFFTDVCLGHPPMGSGR